MKPVCEVFKFSSASLKDMTRRLGRGLWTSCGLLRADKKLSLKADRVGIGSKQYIPSENSDNNNSNCNKYQTRIQVQSSRILLLEV